MTRRGLAIVVVFFVAFLGALGFARATELNVGGSAQLDEHFVATNPKNAHQQGFDGLTTEATVKVAIDVSEQLSGNVKVCYGCHGFEADMAYFDYRVADEFNVRFGRFSPSFGAYNLRHDPGNHRLSDKPLPYDMGRMLRLRDWNLGVLPSPFPDSGLEIDGTHFMGTTQLDYAVYAVAGFKGAKNASDLDFVAQHSTYVVDDNSTPDAGARLAFTARLGSKSDLTLGASGRVGWLDPDRRLYYAFVGADLSLRIDRANLRLEWLARKERMDTSDPTQFRYPVSPSGYDTFVKHGAYVELEQPLSRTLDAILRVDALYRSGNVLTNSALDRHSSVVRWTIGSAYSVERNLRLKASGEIWHFSDLGSDGRHDELSFHFAVVGTY